MAAVVVVVAVVVAVGAYVAVVVAVVAVVAVAAERRGRKVAAGSSWHRPVTILHVDLELKRVRPRFHTCPARL